MPRRLTIPALARELAPGARVYLPGSAGEPTAFFDELSRDRDRPGLDVVTAAVPGINPLDLDALPAGTRVSSVFMQPRFAAAQREGRFRHLPLSYSGFLRHLREGPDFDACVLQVAPPDATGRCSLGPAVEFTPIATARSRRLYALINPNVPAIPGADSIAYDDLDAVAESDAALRTYDVGPPTPEAVAIATHVAALIGDGATVQVGLGKVPEALFALLRDRRGLKLHSGMFSDSLMGLAESDALDPRHSPVSCVLVGSDSLYAWSRDRPGIEVRSCEITHGPARLTTLERFVAVNGALSVDLFGQCNLEFAGGRAVSGVGGAPDFARAARQSPGGISIVALPATHGGGSGSRILPRMADELVSLSRADVDVVVTEEGVADLRGRSVHERAEALMAVAAPAHRAGLADAWKAAAARL